MMGKMRVVTLPEPLHGGACSPCALSGRTKAAREHPDWFQNGPLRPLEPRFLTYFNGSGNAVPMCLSCVNREALTCLLMGDAVTVGGHDLTLPITGEEAPEPDALPAAQPYARLNAAAPELLRACVAFLTTFGPGVDAYANYDGRGTHGAGWGEVEAVELGREAVKLAGYQVPHEAPKVPASLFEEAV